MSRKTQSPQPPRSDSGIRRAPGPRGADDKTDNNVDNEGPERTLQVIDRENQWDAVARERGYQSGDQGGYKGSYDETKFEPLYRRVHGSGGQRATGKKTGGAK